MSKESRGGTLSRRGGSTCRPASLIGHGDIKTSCKSARMDAMNNKMLLVTILALLLPQIFAAPTISERRGGQFQPDAVLIVSDSKISPDCTIRQSVVFNGTSPGPVLRFKEGQHVFVRVYNARDGKNTTVHFHGLSQYLSPYADGTPQTSQVNHPLPWHCVILSGC